METLSAHLFTLSSPSGSGKSTIIQGAIAQNPHLELCISATTRAPRGSETHGKEYYFYQSDEFQQLIKEDFFLEYEEVYPGKFYGTPKSEITRIADAGKTPLLDIDVMGALKLKERYGSQITAMYVQVMAAARQARLAKRNTESLEEIEKRMQKSFIEEKMLPRFDRVISNVLSDNGAFATEQFIRTIRRISARLQVGA